MFPVAVAGILVNILGTQFWELILGKNQMFNIQILALEFNHFLRINRQLFLLPHWLEKVILIFFSFYQNVSISQLLLNQMLYKTYLPR